MVRQFAHAIRPQATNQIQAFRQFNQLTGNFQAQAIRQFNQLTGSFQTHAIRQFNQLTGGFQTQAIRQFNQLTGGFQTQAIRQFNQLTGSFQTHAIRQFNQLTGSYQMHATRQFHQLTSVYQMQATRQFNHPTSTVRSPPQSACNRNQPHIFCPATSAAQFQASQTQPVNPPVRAASCPPGTRDGSMAPRRAGKPACISASSPARSPALPCFDGANRLPSAPHRGIIRVYYHREVLALWRFCTWISFRTCWACAHK